MLRPALASGDARIQRHVSGDDGRRWWALIALCLSSLMIGVDGAGVTVAMPSMQMEFGVSDGAIVWVVNAYLVPYAACRMLGGRLGDIFGHRKLFLRGICLFTVASLGCAGTDTWPLLVVARLVQGASGAVVITGAIALLVSMFREPVARARAIGVYGFVGSGGVAIGMLFGGIATSILNWRWLFLVNFPLGIAVYILATWTVSEHSDGVRVKTLNIPAAALATTAVMVLVYGIVEAGRAGWSSSQALVSFATAGVALSAFILLENRTTRPFIPRELWRMRRLQVCLVVIVFSSAAGYAEVFASFYMQLVLGHPPLQVGLAFLPSSVVTAVVSLGVSTKLALNLGIKRALVLALTCSTLGLLLLSRIPVDGEIVMDVLPGLMLLDLGTCIAFNQALLAATSGVPVRDSGSVSGLLAANSVIGAALGLSVFASIAHLRARHLLMSAFDTSAALCSGYRLAFTVGAVSAAVAGLVAMLLLRLDAQVSDP